MHPADHHRVDGPPQARKGKTMPTHFSRDEIVVAFKEAQHADFSMTQIERMVQHAEIHGASRDYGDGFNIVRVDDKFIAQVNGIWII